MNRSKGSLIAITALALASCEANPTVVESYTLKSPTGSHQLSVAYEQYAGPGNNSIFGRATLKFAGRDDVQDILDIDVQDVSPAHIRAHWIDDKTLLLTVQNADIVFQAVRCAGVTIITRQA